MTDQTGIGRPTTYHAASAAYSYTGDARARHDELAQREQLARAYATLKTRGEYDPGKHGSGDTEALTLAGCLEILATGEVVARTCRHPVDVDRALAAGCGLGSGGGRARLPRGHARQDYRESAADFGTSARPRLPGRCAKTRQARLRTAPRVEEPPSRTPLRRGENHQKGTHAQGTPRTHRLKNKLRACLRTRGCDFA